MSARWLARVAFLLVLAAVADIEAGHMRTVDHVERNC